MAERPFSGVLRGAAVAAGVAVAGMLGADPALADGDSYTVQSGDSPWSVAASQGVGWLDLLHLNGLDMGSVIQPGQQLTLRPTAAPAPAPTPAPPAAAPKQQGLFSIAITIPPASQPTKAPAHPAVPAPATVPTTDQVRGLIRSAATRLGVDPALAVAVAEAGSGLEADAVSPSGALGPLQVMPANTDWASALVGHHLDLHTTADSVEAGVAILRWAAQNTPSTAMAIAAYRQGLASVEATGINADTAQFVAQVEHVMAAG